MANVETLQQKLEKIVPKYIAKYIIWYYSDKKARCPFDELQPYEPIMKNKTENDCLEWLTREDTQNALLVYHKHMKKLKMLQLYESMYDKAIGGNVNAAKWVEDFSNSDFFDESSDEMNDFLNDINIPALKKDGGKRGNK